MKVQDLMTTHVETCHPQDSLASVAQLMWERDCGCVPIVDSRRTCIGMLTDRDVCMTAYIEARPLREIEVSVPLRDDPASDEVWHCRPGDAIEMALGVMQRYKVHRIPVLDDGGGVVGILSIDDIALEAARQRDRESPEITFAKVGETLAAICEPDPES